jgi:hypothetical protein
MAEFFIPGAESQSNSAGATDTLSLQQGITQQEKENNGELKCVFHGFSNLKWYPGP